MIESLPEDVPPDSGSPDNYFNLLVVDASLADRHVVKQRVLDYLKSSRTNTSLQALEAKDPDEAMRLFSLYSPDLVIFDINFNPLNPGNREGIERFYNRIRDYQIPAICWAQPEYSKLLPGVEFISKANGDYKGLPKIIEHVLNSWTTKHHQNSNACCDSSKQSSSK